MSPQRRTPGTTRIEDRWYTRDKQPTKRHGEGARWMLRWVDNEGKERTKSFPRKTDAQRHQNEIQSALTRGDYLDPHAGRITIEELYKDVSSLTYPTLKPTTRNDRTSNWNKHLKADWGKVEVGSVTKADVARWVLTKHQSGVKRPTLNTSLIILRAVFNHAVDEGKIRANPCLGVKLPKAAAAPRHILTITQVETLATAMPYGGLVVRFLAYTGLRFGELAALTVSDLDMGTHRANVTKSTTEVAGELITGPTKTHEARTVPFPSILDTDLAPLLHNRSNDELVFLSQTQRPLRNSNFRLRAFSPTVKKLQASDSNFPAVTLHDLRHTAASIAISQGANVKAVQRMLGHSSAAMTLDTYADLFDTDLDTVGARIDEAVRISVAD